MRKLVHVAWFVVVGHVAIGGAVVGGSSCTRTAPDQAGVTDVAPPVVTDESTSLLFSYVDELGRVQAVSAPKDVPAAVKSRVLVVDLDKTPEQRQAHRVAFFADLTAKGPDGRYPVTVVSRYDAARGQAQAALAPPPADAVVVYSAAWCGFCKKTKAWLKEHDVAFVERDVEKTPGAQAELDGKLRAANVAGGGIPVVDWAGTLVMGFDVPAFEKLRAAAR